jgi:hypothetical protein
MATHSHTVFKTHDDYMTPKSAWEAIEDYIPKDKVIWEAFYGDGASGRYLTEMGREVIHKEIDFFEHDLGEVVVSNPPFSDAAQVLQRLVELNKPFILLMPSQKTFTKYFSKLFKNDPNLRILIPEGRIQYKKLVDGKPVESKSSCAFDSVYYCWRIPETEHLPNLFWL